jgi:hypothetical protein
MKRPVFSHCKKIGFNTSLRRDLRSRLGTDYYLHLPVSHFFYIWFVACCGSGSVGSISFWASRTRQYLYRADPDPFIIKQKK